MGNERHDPDPDADWGDFFTPIETTTLFECNSTSGGRYSAICVYADLIVVEGPDLPDGRVDLVPRDVVAWWMRDAGDLVEVGFEADRVYIARLPLMFARALGSALHGVLGGSVVAQPS